MAAGAAGVWLPLLLLQLQATGTEAACHTCPGIEHAPSGYHSVSYTESNEFLDNPDRGFYLHMETRASNLDHLSVSQLDGYRSSQGLTLAMRMYVLDGGLADHSLPSSLLHHIDSDLQIFRQAGWSVVIRFAYTVHQTSSAPYGDATKARMLEHISQLRAVWNQFEGTLTAIAAGFIGTWGEWCYTTHFGDPNHLDWNFPHGLTPAQWQDRQDVLTAIIDNAPRTVPVLIRTPYSKMHMFGSTPTTLNEVSSGTHKGRTGHHNDCFLASSTDMGTYSDLASEKAYLEQDTRYLPMGGETCAVNSPRSDCPTAKTEMQRFHWSLINHEYHPDVTGGWMTQGCYNEIRNRLGYRLHLKRAVLPTSVGAGGDLCYHITLSNSGFAAPFKPWAVSLVLKNGAMTFSGQLSDVDVRTWQPGRDIVLSGAVKVPPSLPSARYQMFLTLVKTDMTWHADSYVLLANTGNTDHSSGLNPLHASVQVVDTRRPIRMHKRRFGRQGSQRQTAHRAMVKSCAWVSGHGRSSSSCRSLASWTPPHPSRYPRVHTSGGCTPVAVTNPSFESRDSGWTSYTGGFSVSSHAAQEGSHCIQVSDGGANQALYFSPPVEKLVLTAYSRHSGHSTSATADYSLYCDITTPSGSHVYGENAPFTAGNSHWHKVQLDIHVSQGISKANCYLLYRNLASLGGHAYFDNVKAWKLPASDSFSDCHT